MKRIYSFITSLPFMAFLFLILAFSMGIATFVESSYGTPAARALIYNTRWFELIWLLLAINLANNLFRFRLYTKQRLTIGIFHLSFLVILLGAGVTRFLSFEGMMHIREGESSSHILSSDNYFYASLDEQAKERRVQFSEITPNGFSEKFELDGRELSVKTVGYLTDAIRTPMPAPGGEPVIDFVFSAPSVQGMQSFTFQKGNLLDLPGFKVGFETAGPADIRLFGQQEQLLMLATDTVSEMAMGTQQSISFAPGDTIELKKMFLYSFGNYRFLIRNHWESAIFTAAKGQQGETGEDAVLVKISDGLKERVVPVFGHPGNRPDTLTIPVGSATLRLAYGAKPLAVPFAISLRDFQLEHYPGSNSPSSFASEVTLSDPGRQVERDVRIFMNNTLTYRGYKFFQSSYDMDEGGTILSVNHDFWGTWITYIGYFLLTVGMILSLVNSRSYFRHLTNKLKGIQTATLLLFLALTTGSFEAGAQPGTAAAIPSIDQEVVKEFGRMWVQGRDGRIEPVSTLASEVVRKISRKSSLYGKSPEEVMLSMMTWPEQWQSLPVVKIANKTLAAELGASGSYLALRDLFDQEGNYRIADKVREAYNKMPAFRNQLEKEYLYVDERVNICFMVFRSGLLQIFPTGKTKEPWMAPGTPAAGLPEGDSLFVKSGMQLMIESIAGQKSVEALQVIKAVENFQKNSAPELLPSDSKRKVEIAYNKINIFKRIFPFYLLLGFVLLFLLFLNIFRQRSMSRTGRYLFYGLIFAVFLLHTAGLVVRWYISGHAPWSNGYESVVYVAWAAMLAGLIFGRKYPMVVGTAAFLSGIALFVAHLSWMNPEVTHLVPVLKSYWLAIHVAVITASYGFIGLSAFLGILVLILMVLRNRQNSKKVTGFIEQLTTINEMSATVGLYFLTIGTFLGAIWANESWGRYWGWDPKETWSLITIVLYSFIVHMRLIPQLKGTFNYNLASVIGLASVLMTYFGVNYYLAGLHSYGRGVADGVHWAVPVSFLLLITLMVLAGLKDSRFEKENTPS